MRIPVHEFPPSVWTIQDWSVGGILSIFVFGVLAPLVAARFSKPSLAYLVAWGGFIVVVGLITSSGTFPANRTYDPRRYILLLPAFLLLIAIVVTLRLWWRLESWKDMLRFAGVVLLVLFVVTVGILPGPGSREPNSRTRCKNNLKQLGLAMHNYHDVFAVFPDAAAGAIPVSWRVALLPFVEQSALWQQYDLERDWDSIENKPLQKQLISVLDCIVRPKSRDQEDRFLTAYTVPTIPGSIFSNGRGSAIETIADGTSNTLMVLEACGTKIVWSEPRDQAIAAPLFSVNGPGAAIGLSDSVISSWHADGAQVALADGSVRFVSESIEPDVLRSLLTKSGGEPMTEW